MTFPTERDIQRLTHVHPDLVSVFMKAHELLPKTTMKNGTPCQFDFEILEGLRSPEKEAEAVTAGKSDTKHSRHIHGFAVDFGALVNRELTWDEQYYHQIADALLQAGALLGIPVVWGGSWTKPHDCDHLELNRNFYPDPPAASV